MAALVIASSALLAVGGGTGANAADQGAGAELVARGMSKPTFSPKSGEVGTKVKIKGKCGNIGLGKVLFAEVGFYFKDAFSTPSGIETFHEAKIKGGKAKEYTKKLKVGPAHKYMTGSGATPGPVVKRKPEAGDKLFIQTVCQYEGSAYPAYKSAKGKFKVK